jgi:hypothetical protein
MHLTDLCKERVQAKKLIREMSDSMMGFTAHSYQGGCPDKENLLARDPDCAACQLLVRAKEYLDG